MQCIPYLFRTQDHILLLRSRSNQREILLISISFNLYVVKNQQKERVKTYSQEAYAYLEVSLPALEKY